MIPGFRKVLLGEVASNVAATMFGSLFARAFSAITLIYVMRVIGATSFGLLTFGVSIVAYASMLVTPGILVWGTRAVACEPGRTKTFLVLINATQLVLAVIAFLLLVFTSRIIFEPGEQKIVTVAGAALFALALSVDWVCQGLQRFRLATAGQVVASVLTLSATLVLVRSSSDVYFVPVIAAAGQIVGAILVTIVLWRSEAFVGSIDWRAMGTVLRASFPLGASLMLVTVLHYANNIALQLFRGSRDLGVFAGAYRIFEICCLLPILTASVFLPRISQRAGEPKRDELRTLIRLIMSAGAVVALVMSVEADMVVKLFLGASFTASAPVLRVLGASLFFSFGAIGYINGLLGYGRDRAYFWSLFVPMVISVSGALFLVPRLGVTGATYTVATLDLATVLVCLVPCRRAAGTIFLEEWIRPVLSAAVAAAALFGMRYANIVFPVRLFVTVTIYAFLVIPWREMRDSVEVGSVGECR